MKRRVLSLLLVLAMVVGLLPAAALAAGAGTIATTGKAGDNITWTYDAAAKTMTFSGVGTMYDYSEDYPEWAQGNGYDDVETLIIGEGVTAIGAGAFWATDFTQSLTEIRLPSSLTTIGSQAFYDTESVGVIQLPASVTKIDEEAFGGWSAAQMIVFPDDYDKTHLESFGSTWNGKAQIAYGALSLDGGFSGKCGENAAFTYDSKSETVTISGSGAIVPPAQFPDDAYWAKIRTSAKPVKIASGVTEIGASAFYNWWRLQQLELPDTLAKIGEKAFYNCQKITELVIPASITEIGAYAFQNWANTQTIRFDLTQPEVELKVKLNADWNKSSNAKVRYKALDSAYCAGITIVLKDGGKTYPGTLDLDARTLVFTDEVDMMKDFTFDNPEVVVTEDGQDWKNGTASISGELKFVSMGSGRYSSDAKLVLTPAEGVKGDTVTVGMSFTVTERPYTFQGTGTETDPYIVDSAVALYNVAKSAMVKSSSGKFYKQTKDIDMTDVNWTPIGAVTVSSGQVKIDQYQTFKGTYDGGNFRIRNLVVNEEKKPGIGLFGSVTNGTVKNVVLDSSCSFRTANYSGAIVALAKKASILNCRNEADVYAGVNSNGQTGARAEVGGILGATEDSVLIQGCENYGRVTANTSAAGWGFTGAQYVGGIAASVSSGSRILDVHNYGEVVGGIHVGGLIGSMMGSSSKNTLVIGCSNHGAVSSSYSSTPNVFSNACGSTGGLVGWLTSNCTIEGCYNSGSVTTNWPGAGGLVGQVKQGTVANSYNVGAVTSTYTGEWPVCIGSMFGYVFSTKSPPVWDHNAYLSAGLDAAGVDDYTKANPDALQQPEARTAEELKSADYLKSLQDYFTQELTCTLWAADSTNVNSGYPVITGVREKLDYHKQITEFKLGSLKMTIDEAAGTITGVVTNDVDLTAAAPALKISANAAVSPASGEAVDFTQGPVKYTVTAQDGTTKVYTVTVTKPESGVGLMSLVIKGDYPTGSLSGERVLLSAEQFRQDQLTYDLGECWDGFKYNVLNVTAQAASSTSKIGVFLNGADANGTGNITIRDAYKLGRNVLEIVVTPASGDPVTYTFTFTAKPAVHKLKLTADGMTVTPAIGWTNVQDILEYTLDVAPDTQTIAMTFQTYFDETAASVSAANGTFTSSKSSSPNYAYDYTGSVRVDRSMDKFTLTIAGTGENEPSTTYTFHLAWPSAYDAVIETNVEKANVTVTDPSGAKLMPDESGVYRLALDKTYTYVAAARGYKAQTGTISGPSDLTGGKLSLTLEPVAPSTLKKLDALWPSFRGNESSMAVTSYETAQTEHDASLLWSSATGSGYDSGAVSSPIIVDGYLYAYAGTRLLKIEREQGSVVKEAEMIAASDFAIVPPTYAEGMIFVGLSKGRVQAFNAETLESLWVYADPLQGQANTPITYFDGCVYTGFWNSETKEANFVCLTIDDEDPASATEAKQALWFHTQKGGFYWAGAYAHGSYVVVGTDDGQSGYNSATANLLVFDKTSGELVDSKTGYTGDIRSNIAYDEASDRIYFTSKGGYFYSEKIDWTSGKLDPAASKAVDLGGMSTSTPVVYKGRAYVGVSGKGQFTKYDGHRIAVLDLNSWSIAYTANTMGYPQTSGLLTTAYEQETGYVYVYFMDNYEPGVMRVVKDQAGQTALLDGVTENGYENCAPVVFTPSGELAQYCICSPIADENGVIYFKNDTGYLMAVGREASDPVVKAVEEKISLIGEVSLDSEAAIREARAAYEALTDEQQGRVTNYQTLLDAEDAYAALVDKAAAEAVEDLIDAIGPVTKKSGEKINAARTAYDSLSDEQQALVTNYQTLLDAEKRYKELTRPVTPVTPSKPAEEKPSEEKPEEKPAGDAPKLPFRDVAESSWYYDGVQYAYENGLMNGTGTNVFSPNADTTRGMIVTILARLEGVDASGGAAWYARGREWAMTNGISDGTDMEGAITREQLAAILFRYAQLKGMDAVTLEENLGRFTDRDRISAYAVPAMNWAVGQGLLQGAGGRLDPQGTASRAQVATILMRFLKLISK